MPQPTVQDVHTNVPLTNLSIAYAQDQAEFIADRVFGVVPSDKQTNLFYTYDKAPWFRSDMQKRAPSTETPGTGYTLNKSSYSIDVWGIHDDIDDQERANADDQFQLDADSTELVTAQAMVKRELLFGSTYFGSGIWGNDLTGVASSPAANQFVQWDQAGSDPIGDVKKYIRAIAKATGRRPNKLILGPEVGDALVENAEIVDRVKYTQLGFLDYDLLAKAFGVNEVLVPFAIEDTAQEGASDAMSFIYGKAALLVYAEMSPGRKKPSAGYTFTWNAYMGGTSPRRIKKFRMENIASDRIECEIALTDKVTGTDLGCYFGNAIS